jgi:hypothetical protein
MAPSSHTLPVPSIVIEPGAPPGWRAASNAAITSGTYWAGSSVRPGARAWASASGPVAAVGARAASWARPSVKVSSASSTVIA